MEEKKYHVEKNTVQETLIIPLYGRKVCSERFPELFQDPEAERICNGLDYDFAEKGKKMQSGFGLFGALEVAQRQYDLAYEVKEYLKVHPRACVVNLGCGLDDTFAKCDNGTCRGINVDMPDVIAIRNELLPAREREENVGSDLNEDDWMEKVESEDGAIFFASGVFYYFKRNDLKTMLKKMAVRFPGCVICFDTCNSRGAKLMTKTWIKEAGISDVNALFSLEDKQELEGWSPDFASVEARSYMRGYRDIYSEMSLLYKLMIKFCDNWVNMQIIKITFGKRERT